MSGGPLQRRNRRVQRNQLKGILVLLIVVLIILLIGYIVFTFILPLIHPAGINGSSAITVALAPDNEMIGISDGTHVFDSQSSAEALIYQEDKHVLDTHRHFMTVVVGTILTGTFANSGRDSLQGVYVEQKEYNDQCLKLSSCLPARVLIANSGSGVTASDEVAYATKVAEQIVQARREDKTIVGVMGWPASSDLFYGNTTLGEAHIPVVSPTALLDDVSTSSPYIFSVAPSSTQQGSVGAYYAEHFLNAQRVAVFVDPVDRYSESLADAFIHRFKNDKNTITIIKSYTVGSPESVQVGLPDVLNSNPDLIYFAGHANDIPLLLKGLPTCTASSCLQVLGVDALYELGYPPDLKPYLSRLHFTAFAYPDEWGILAGSVATPGFFSEYSTAFNPKGDHPQGAYGFTRADNNVILSYDATTMLLRTATTIFNDQQTALSPDVLQKALTAQDRQGISGRIAFNSTGDTIDKAMVVLSFDNIGRIHQDQCFGTFLQAGLTNSTSVNCASIGGV